MSEMGFYIDPSRCIGCQACVNACAECDTHRGYPMITVDYLDRAESTATVPTVCMHCDEPTCALVCPADAIKKGDDGVVQSALKPRCVACSNCVLSCPFGVPKMPSQIVLSGPKSPPAQGELSGPSGRGGVERSESSLELMMKCDMCYDRTSIGLRPMCATVCPSGALTFAPPEEIAKRREVATNVFQFGRQTVTTKVFMMVPTGSDRVTVDLADLIWESPT